MKKKLVSTLLCATMLAGMLAGCGGKKTESNTTDKNAADAVTEAASQAADEGKVLNIYCWNEEFKSRITAHYPGYEEVDATHGKILMLCGILLQTMTTLTRTTWIRHY